MKILYLITKSEIGGAQTYTYQLGSFLKAKNYKVGIMSYPGGWLEKKASQNNISFYLNKNFKNTYNPFVLYKAIKRIKKVVNEFKPDLIHCQSTIAGLATRLAVRNKVPTIFTAHGWAFTKGTPFFRKIIAIMIEKLASFYSSKIICVSEFDKKLALKYHIASKNKLVTIYNGVKVKPLEQKQ